MSVSVSVSVSVYVYNIRIIYDTYLIYMHNRTYRSEAQRQYNSNIYHIYNVYIGWRQRGAGARPLNLPRRTVGGLRGRHWQRMEEARSTHSRVAEARGARAAAARGVHVVAEVLSLLTLLVQRYSVYLL